MSFSLFDTVISWVNDLLSVLGENISGIGIVDITGNSAGISVSDFAALFEPIMRTFAYSLCLLLIGINIMESAAQYELFSLRGAIKVGARIFLAKLWIDLASWVCMLIIGCGNDIATSVIDLASDTSEMGFLDGVTVSELLPSSDIPVIGDIVDLLLGIVALLPFLLILLGVGIVATLIIIKLVMRTFELTALVTVSPIFFACIAGEGTKSYFRKFISTFLGAVFQVVFIALVYAMAKYWVASMTMLDPSSVTIDDLYGYGTNVGYTGLILISMGVMIVKPPRFLNDLLAG